MEWKVQVLVDLPRVLVEMLILIPQGFSMSSEIEAIESGLCS